jgi:hypothetical protein
MSLVNMFLQKIDIFGYHASFRIDGKRNLRSEYGGCLTLLIIIFSLMVIFSQGHDFFFRNRPSILNYSITSNQRSQITFPPNTYIPFTLSLYDKQNKIITNNDISFSLEVNQQGNSYVMLPKSCSSYSSYFKSTNNLIFSQQNFYCIDLSGISIGGPNDFVTFYARYCKNPLSCNINSLQTFYLFNNTSPLDYLSDPFNYYFNLLTYIPKYVIDPTQMTPFYQDYMFNNDNTYSQYRLNKNILFKKSILRISDGLLVDNNNTNQIFAIDSVSSSIDQRLGISQNTIVALNFLGGDKIDICSIDHMKFYEAVFYSYVYIKIIYSVMSLFMFFPNRYIFKKVVLDCFFETVEKKTDLNEETLNNVDLSKRLKRKISTKLRVNNNLNDYMEDIKTEKKSLVENEAENKEVLNLNSRNRADNYLIRDNPERQNFNSGNSANEVVDLNNKNLCNNNQPIFTDGTDVLKSNFKQIKNLKKTINEFVRKKLDFRDIIKLRWELDQFKRILLNEKQIEALNYVDKPKAVIEDSRIVELELEGESKLKDQDIINYFVLRINNSTYSDVDNRLLMKLKPYLRKSIEEKI